MLLLPVMVRLQPAVTDDDTVQRVNAQPVNPGSAFAFIGVGVSSALDDANPAIARIAHDALAGAAGNTVIIVVALRTGIDDNAEAASAPAAPAAAIAAASATTTATGCEISQSLEMTSRKEAHNRCVIYHTPVTGS